MEKEIDAGVLAVINEKRLSGAKLTPVEVITKMGVFDARTQASASAWLATGDNVIVTLWAEQIATGENGRWFFLETLDTHQRIGGGERSALQIQRAKDRLQMLQFAMEEEAPVRVALQANRVGILSVESDKDAKISVRVIDDLEWHVADWNPDTKLAVLVRGERGWKPNEAEIKAAQEKPGVPRGLSNANASSDEIQAAAMAYLTKHFTSYGYRAENVNSQNFGYDLEVSDKKGNTLLKLSVKGLGPGVRSFKLSPEERAAADAGDPWRLGVVTDATLPSVAHKIYKPSEVDSASGLEIDL